MAVLGSPLRGDRAVNATRIAFSNLRTTAPNFGCARYARMARRGRVCSRENWTCVQRTPAPHDSLAFSSAYVASLIAYAGHQILNPVENIAVVRARKAEFSPSISGRLHRSQLPNHVGTLRLAAEQ